MSPTIASQIQNEQNHGRTKYGRGPDDFEHDDMHSDSDWFEMIESHNLAARFETPMERRQRLIKVAGLAVSAIESIDRLIEAKGGG